MMRAMQLDRPGAPLRMVERPIPEPGPGELLIEIAACEICRTDLHRRRRHKWPAADRPRP